MCTPSSGKGELAQLEPGAGKAALRGQLSGRDPSLEVSSGWLPSLQAPDPGSTSGISPWEITQNANNGFGTCIHQNMFGVVLAERSVVTTRTLEKAP